jgi:hypothetical protein
MYKVRVDSKGVSYRSVGIEVVHHGDAGLVVLSLHLSKRGGG